MTAKEESPVNVNQPGLTSIEQQVTTDAVSIELDEDGLPPIQTAEEFLATPLPCTQEEVDAEDAEEDCFSPEEWDDYRFSVLQNWRVKKSEEDQREIEFAKRVRTVLTEVRETFKNDLTQAEKFARKKVTYSQLFRAEEIADKVRPGIRSLEAFLEEQEDDPAAVIEEMLALGSVCLLQGASKTNKSWTAKEIGIRVAQGQVWLGKKCNAHRVLYVNAEIRSRVLRKRLKLLMDRKVLGSIPQGQLDLLNLRGCDAPIDSLTQDICEDTRHGHYGLIIIDPIYTLLGDREENANEDIAQVIKLLHKITEHTGAAVIFVHHHSKGQQGGKRALERSSGAGAFGRGPDLIIDIEPVRDAFEFDVTQREFAPTPIFYAKRVEGPMWQLCDADEVSQIAEDSSKPGPDAEFKVEALLKLIPEGGIRHTALKKECALTGMSVGQFNAVFKKAQAEAISKDDNGLYTVTDKGKRMIQVMRITAGKQAALS